MLRSTRISRGMCMLGLCCALVGFTIHCGVSHAEEKRTPIGVPVQKNIRVVCQIKNDHWKRGIGHGLILPSESCCRVQLVGN